MGGTGQKFEAAATITAGVASLVATLMSIVYASLSLVNAALILRLLIRLSLQQIDMAANVRSLRAQPPRSPAYRVDDTARTTENRCYNDMWSAFCSCTVTDSAVYTGRVDLCSGFLYTPSRPGPAWSPAPPPTSSTQYGISTKYLPFVSRISWIGSSCF